MYYKNVLNEYVNRNMKLVATLWKFLKILIMMKSIYYSITTPPNKHLVEDKQPPATQNKKGRELVPLVVYFLEGNYVT
jgi:hypothetical protein